jgi:hypothetical protein
MVEPTFYVYAYLREDLSPYYIGKGTGNRAFTKGAGEVKPPKEKSRVVILKDGLCEQTAFNLEKQLISRYGRKDLLTGILHNKTDGGDGPSGRVFSLESRKLMSANRAGKGLGKQTPEHIEAKAAALRGKKHSPEQVEANAASKRGVKFTKERCANISASLRGKPNGRKGLPVKPRSAASIEKQKKTAKGNINIGPQSSAICPYCEKEGGVSNIKRYHFNNCKQKVGI